MLRCMTLLGMWLAVFGNSAVTAQTAKEMLGACPNPDTTATSIVRVFVGYGLAHPEKLQYNHRDSCHAFARELPGAANDAERVRPIAPQREPISVAAWECHVRM